MRAGAVLVFALGGCRGPATPPEPDTAESRSNASIPTGQVSDVAMIAIAGGPFVDSRPGELHELAPFRLDVHEVTVAAYRACVEAGACRAQSSAWWRDEEQQEPQCNFTAEVNPRDAHPMNCVDWTNAAAYCRWAGKRLPTEWEWEWAARGRDEERHYVWGASEPDERVCWQREFIEAGTCEVASMATDVSRDGIRDLGGNVREWTDTPGEGFAEGEPGRLNRGGSWKTREESDLRVTDYYSYPVRVRLEELGFRCAAGADGSQ